MEEAELLFYSARVRCMQRTNYLLILKSKRNVNMWTWTIVKELKLLEINIISIIGPCPKFWSVINYYYYVLLLKFCLFFFSLFIFALLLFTYLYLGIKPWSLQFSLLECRKIQTNLHAIVINFTNSNAISNRSDQNKLSKCGFAFGTDLWLIGT